LGPGQLNNRAEHAHQPVRAEALERAQRFLAAYGPIAGHFRPRRHRLTATAYRQRRDRAFATWREVTGMAAAA
jgi:putative transposase